MSEGTAKRAACPRVLVRWRAEHPAREACVAQRLAARLRRERATCAVESPTGSNCTGYADAAAVLDAYAQKLRSIDGSGADGKPTP